MVRYESTRQLTIEEFKTPFQKGLSANNRWVKLSKLLPWDRFAEIYLEVMDKRMGRPELSPRIVLGALIIKHMKKLDSLCRCSLRNRYHWKLFAAINDFQITAPRMILALQECDTGNEMRRQAGKENVYQALKAFDRAWDQLQRVYGKTRFLAYPLGYVPDRYYHFASQREDLSWMIQPEELLFPRVKQWLEDPGFQKPAGNRKSFDK